MLLKRSAVVDTTQILCENKSYNVFQIWEEFILRLHRGDFKKLSGETCTGSVNWGFSVKKTERFVLKWLLGEIELVSSIMFFLFFSFELVKKYVFSSAQELG